jgi:hypothetical protein
MITQTVTTSFKSQAVQAGQNLATDTIRCALYNGNASLTGATTAYTAVNEITGTGYTAGGELVTGATINTDPTSGVLYISFNNILWSPAAFTCRGALFYNVTRSNASIFILNFGADKTCNTTFQITFPANTSTSAVLRQT